MKPGTDDRRGNAPGAAPGLRLGPAQWPRGCPGAPGSVRFHGWPPHLLELDDFV